MTSQPSGLGGGRFYSGGAGPPAILPQAPALDVGGLKLQCRVEHRTVPISCSGQSCNTRLHLNTTDPDCGSSSLPPRRSRPGSVHPAMQLSFLREENPVPTFDTFFH